MLDRFLSTFSLVSRIPVKLKFNFDPSRTDFYLPVTGIFSALLGLAIFWGGSFLGKNPLISVLSVLIPQYLCFNLFHLDGLADTADAFLGTFDREKRRAILKDSRTGVYGTFAVFAALSLKTALLCGLFPAVSQFPLALLAYPLPARFSAALIPCMAPPANPESLGALTKDSSAPRCVFGIITAALLWVLPVWGLLSVLGTPGFTLDGSAFPGLLLAGISLVILSPLTAFFYARLYRKGIGGYSGDALGAAIETVEILYLATALAVISFLFPIYLKY
jgi:adenosylcobinamide-GDP ribazoletransferase